MHGIAAKEYTNLCLLPCPSLPFPRFHFFSAESAGVQDVLATRQEKYPPPVPRTLCKGNGNGILQVGSLCVSAPGPQITPNMRKREPKSKQTIQFPASQLRSYLISPTCSERLGDAPSFVALKCTITTPLFFGMMTEMVAFSVPGSRPVAHTKLPSVLPCLGLD